MKLSSCYFDEFSFSQVNNDPNFDWFLIIGPCFQVHLLNWRGQALLNVSETNLLLSKLQELSMAKLHPDFSNFDLPAQALATVRLALAANLRQAILEES